MLPSPLLLSLALLSATFASPTPQIPGDSGLAGTEPPSGPASCTHPFSCHPQDAQGNHLVRGVPGAISPASYYSIFECVYEGPRTEEGVKTTNTCSYDKITGTRSLRPLPDTLCQPTALPCASDPNFNPHPVPVPIPTPTPDDAPHQTGSTGEPANTKVIVPLFSSQDEGGKEVVYEVPPWMPMGRDLMRLKMEHQ